VFHAGQTFLYPLNDDSQTEHLWIIATEPNAEQAFATVSFTSLRGAKDPTVTLLKGEHPFLKWDTCISYAQAEIVTEKKLQAHLDYGRAKMHAPATPVLLQIDPGWFLGFQSHQGPSSGLRAGLQASSQLRS
jgi:hypothetical protein